MDFLFTDAMLANGPIATAAGQYYGYAKKADGSTYSEPGNEGDPMDYYQIQTWDKNNKWRNLNWCWEGSMALSEYIPVQPGAELTASYAMWCFNDNTGDMISFEPNGNGPPVPEPASVGLLGLAVAGIAAGFRRRRSK